LGESDTEVIPRAKQLVFVSDKLPNGNSVIPFPNFGNVGSEPLVSDTEAYNK
jgi:hypothetical protein